MTKELTLTILTPSGTVFGGPVDAVFLPGTAGPFEVLPGHAPIISSLEKGRIVWRSASSQQSLNVSGGAIILENNTLTVCAQPEK